VSPDDRNPDGRPLTKEELLQRLATLVIDSNDAIILLTMNGNILAWNMGAERIYGYTQDEALRMNILAIVPENERAKHEEMMDKLRRGEAVQSFETRRITKDGRILEVWLTISVLKDESGKPYAISVTERDFTGIKRREDELRASNEELSATEEELKVNLDELTTAHKKLARNVEVLNAILRITTSAFKTIELDNLVHNILSTLMEVMKADAAVILLHEGDIERVYAGIGAEEGVRMHEAIPFGKGFAGVIAETKKMLYIEDAKLNPHVYSQTLKKAGVRSMLGVPMIANDNLVGVIHVDWVSFHPFNDMELDILRASAERCAMAIMNSRLYEKTVNLKRQVELYLDIMGHDINNLNQITLTNLEFLQKNDNLTVQQLDALNDCINSVESSSNIISNVRKIQQITEEKPVITSVDINELIISSIRDVPKPADRKVIINYKPGSGFFVYGTALMKEVFSNIINNAIKHSVKDVTIDIMVNEIKRGGKRFYDVIVADNGPGIPDGMKLKIFNRFQQSEARVHGRGLGLFIVHSLVERSGGNVTVEDRVPGDYTKGARFIVSLPVCEVCK
jgi:PAS domain S-box-containing protein